MVDESMEIDKKAFEKQVSYITGSHKRIWLWSFWLSIIATCFLCLAGCFQCIWLMNTPVKKHVEARVLRAAAAEREAEVVDDEKEHNAVFMF